LSKLSKQLHFSLLTIKVHLLGDSRIVLKKPNMLAGLGITYYWTQSLMHLQAATYVPDWSTAYPLI